MSKPDVGIMLGTRPCCGSDIFPAPFAPMLIVTLVSNGAVLAILKTSTDKIVQRVKSDILKLTIYTGTNGGITGNYI